MIIIIPLGGSGDRFKQNGYSVPKGLIKVFGKPILYYLLDNIVKCKNIDFVYIPYNKEYGVYRFEDLLRKDYPTILFRFLQLHHNTGGAAETLNVALRDLTCTDTAIVSLDGDNFYTVDFLSQWDLQNRILAFEDLQNDPIYSYIQMENGHITDIVEKQKTSNYACSGVYGFASYKQLLHYTQYVIDHNIKQKGEYYISNVIKAMLQDNITFQYSLIDRTQWHCLGTPMQVQQFCANSHNLVKLKQMRFCFDLDNTLVTFPKVHNDYTTVEPIWKNIRFLQTLKKSGHTIIIHTARRMKTHNGNVGKIMKDIGKLTFDTLEKFDIPYDELYFGKPQADVYIDDLAINCHDDLEKMLGFYMNTVSPRDFNQLSGHSIRTITKKSNDLTGEIYYYENIPKQIKDLFPVFIEGDIHGKWYTMEQISGLTCTSMYLSEMLSCDHLSYIMTSLKRIHSVDLSTNTNMPIYNNYCGKLRKRYTEYDYSQFPKSEEIYSDLYEKLRDYEENGRGKMRFIHGDPVLSNILINTNGKIKFIDMRGKLGDTLTTYGDWLYDWSKLYQSLIGYDKILQGKTVSDQYERKMKEYFETTFVQMYSETDLEHLKTITKSLLFTLIPLHNNSKCVDYFKLIKTIE